MTPLLAETVAKLEEILPGANFLIDLDGTPTLSGKAVLFGNAFDSTSSCLSSPMPVSSSPGRTTWPVRSPTVTNPRASRVASWRR